MSITGMHVKAVVGGKNFTQYVGLSDLNNYKKTLVLGPNSGALSISFPASSICLYYVCFLCILLMVFGPLPYDLQLLVIT